MAKYLLSFLLIFALVSTSFKMDRGDKVKVKFKKGFVIVDGGNWAEYRHDFLMNQTFLKTLNKKDFLKIDFVSIPQEGYDVNGKPNKLNYIEVNFYNDSIGIIEVNSTKRGLIRNLVEMEVLVNDEINWKNIKRFKTKYSEDISSKYKKKETIIIIK